MMIAECGGSRDENQNKNNKCFLSVGQICIVFACVCV